MKPKKTKTVKKTEKKTPKIDRIKELAKTIAGVADDTKAENIVTLDLRHLSTIADYLVICSATNPRQMKAISENVVSNVSATLGRKPLSTEGLQNAAWVLVDYGDVVCHIFTEEMRQFYRLEQLWHDAKKVIFRKTKK